MTEYLPPTELHSLTGLKLWQAKRRAAAKEAEQAQKEQAIRWEARRPEREQMAKERAIALQRQRSSRRRAAERQRAPAWANRKLVQAVFLEAERLSRITGVPHHVDHIIPLCGQLVSGLHVHQNLQAIPAFENMKKHNRFEVEA